MIITHNMASINTNRQLGINQDNAGKSLEKLSSGFRINKAGDDAAGLAISEKMRSQIRGLDQAGRNSQDGISMIQTAESSLSETQNILQRMKELATQSANDTNVTSDRGEIQKEMNQLSSEVNRIGNTTEFNTKKLLNGGGDVKTVAAGVLSAGGGSAAIGGFYQVNASVKEVVGKFTVAITTSAAAGATLQVAGQTFKVVVNNADAAKGEINAGNTAAIASGLAAAVNANATLHDRFTNATSTAGKVSLIENAGKAVGGTTTTSLGTVSGVGVTMAATAGSSSVKEASGKYTMNLDKAFQLAGATVKISGQKLTAVAAGAVGADTFEINTDKVKQAKAMAAAINTDTSTALGKRFEATTNGTTITLTERAQKATGANLATTSVVVNATTPKAGKFDVNFSSLTSAGGRITIDGQDIAVTSDANDAGLVSGKSMMAGSTLKEQAANLASAITKNATLTSNYSVITNAIAGVTLTQQAGKETLTGPVTSTNTSQKDGFEATLQIGANTAQSMTVTVTDMRADALNITSADPNQTTVTAKNGAVASFTAATSVTDGTTNTTTEYALDVSTHEKATAAISVLDDAIQGVSAQRSQLGAFQNRLEHTISNLGTSSENLTAAESRVRDVDMAKEMMNFQKNNILQQAATAMMAQANQLPQGVLQLLR